MSLHIAVRFISVAKGVLTIALTFTVRIWLPVGWYFAPLGLQFPFFPPYIALFAAGIIAHRNNWFTTISDAAGRFWLRTALALIVLFPVMFAVALALGANRDSAIGGFSRLNLAYAL